MNEREGKFNTKGFLYRNGNSEVYNSCGKERGTLDTTTNNFGEWVALGPQTTTQKLQIVEYMWDGRRQPRHSQTQHTDPIELTTREEERVEPPQH